MSDKYWVGGTNIWDVNEPTSISATSFSASSTGFADIGNGRVCISAGNSFKVSNSSFILDNVIFNVSKIGSPTGSCYARLYSSTGTYGTTSIPNVLLATSDAVNIGTMSPGNVSFTFSGANKYVLQKDTAYVIQLYYTGGDVNNCLIAFYSSNGYTGNLSRSDGANMNSWVAIGSIDMLFEIKGTPIKWATTSGGLVSTTKPLSTDNVFFDTNSGSSTVTVVGSVNMKDFDATNFVGTIAHSGTCYFNIYGNAIWGSGMTFSYNQSTVFQGNGTQTINTNGIYISGPITMYKLNGSTLSTNSNIDCYSFATSVGIFNSNNFNITGRYGITFAGTPTYPSTINMGSGTWNIKNYSFQASSSGVTINASTSTFIIESVNAYSFAGGSHTFNNVILAHGTSTQTITISGSNTFNSLSDTGTAAHTIKFTDGTNQTVSSISINGSAGKLITLTGTSTAGWTITDTTGTNAVTYCNISYSTATGGATWSSNLNNGNVDGGNNTGWIFITAPVVTTEAVTSIKSLLATGNGTIVSNGGANISERGICWKTSTNPTIADSKVIVAGTTGSYTGEISPLNRNTLYYVKAYATNSVGTSYGSEVTFTTLQFTNPANIYSSNDVYATVAAISGVLTVEVSKDAGANWQLAKTVTFTSSDSVQTCGTGSAELWGSSFTRADMVDANFRIRLSHNGISQVYKTFGFATGSQTLTGVEVAIEGKYASSTISLDHLKVKIYYGTSVLPVQAGSQAYASDGRKAGEGAGAGTGVLCFYDGTNWISCDSGATVAA